MRFNVSVNIRLKDGIVDPEGASTLKALELLGFTGVSDVRTSKVFELSVEAQDERALREMVDGMCAKLLSNPVLNECRVEFR